MFYKEHPYPRHLNRGRRKPSIWNQIAKRYGIIPLVLAFVFVSISLVGTAFELLYLWIRHA